MFDTENYTALFERIAAVRAHRDRFLDELKGADLTLDELFERGATDPVIGSMKVLPAVEALPDAAKVQTRRAFEDVGIAEDALIGEVQSAQLAQLPEALGRHAR